MVTSPVSERRRKLLSVRWLMFAALVLAVIVFATLCPMPLRPRLFENPDLERLTAFAALGFAAKLAFPRKHHWTILALGKNPVIHRDPRLATLMWYVDPLYV